MIENIKKAIPILAGLLFGFVIGYITAEDKVSSLIETVVASSPSSSSQYNSIPKSIEE